MSQAEPAPPATRRWTRFALPVLLWGLIGAGVLYALFWSERPPADLEELDLTGVTDPHTVPAVQSTLPDQAEVIGVTIDGRHRAYALSPMSDITRHVVNDRLAETPVAVTYCDRSNCVKVYRGDRKAGLLNVGIGGYLGTRSAGTLLLKLGGTRFRQDTGQAVGSGGATFPLRETDVTRTTWREWRRMHPDSDVYDGTAEGLRYDTR